MKRITIKAEIDVPDSLVHLVKEKGIELIRQDGKYQAKIGETIIRSKDMDIMIDTSRVSVLDRSRKRGTRKPD